MSATGMADNMDNLEELSAVSRKITEMLAELPDLKFAAGVLIHRARLDAGMTQQELADVVSCSTSLITHYEHGGAYVTPEMLGRIVEALQEGRNTDE